MPRQLQLAVLLGLMQPSLRPLPLVLQVLAVLLGLVNGMTLTCSRACSSLP